MTESHRRQLIDMVARPEDEVDLARASLLVACDEYPRLEVDHYLQRLDTMAEALRGRLGASPEAAIAGLNRVLFEEEGFRGNTREYYDPRNSFLNDVLDRRMGIPITLSTVYIEVARRAGLHVEGVGLPGHFIVRVNVPGRGVLIDPYHCGALLSEKECQDRLDRIFGGRVKVEARMLSGCGRKAMIERMLRNLKAIYMKDEDYSRALGAVELLLRLDPENAEDLRDRGVLFAALDCYGLATRDLEAYLALAPRGPEAEELAARIAMLRQKASRLN